MKPAQIENNIGHDFNGAEVISAVFDQDFRMATLQSIRFYGITRTQASLEAGGLNKKVAKAVIRNIIRKYGW